MLSFRYVDCEPTLDNFWANAEEIDKHHNLQHTCMLYPGYFKFEENKGIKTPKDFELELRQRSIDTGLIAIIPNAQVQQAINDNKIIFIKQKYAHLYCGDEREYSTSSPKPEHVAKYELIYSCRPRQEVIEETLTHHSSIDENLKKLEEAGIGIVVNTTEDRIIPTDIVPSESTKQMSAHIMEGTKRIIVSVVDPEQIFNDIMNNNEGAELALIAMTHNGGAIMGIVKDGHLLSDIGLQIDHDTYGNKRITYVPIKS